MSLKHQEEPIRSTSGVGDTFGQIMERRLSRRGLLKSLATASAAAATISVLGQPSPAEAAESPSNDVKSALVHGAVQTSEGFVGLNVDAPVVAAGYKVTTLLKWGDPVVEGAPEFNPNNYTAAAQEQQFGYNCDFVGFMPLPQGSDASDKGLLVVNHEYTNPELMFSGYNLDEPEPTQGQVDIELAAHGISVVEVERGADGQWQAVIGPANQRITATTPMMISGPAAGNDLLKTSEDPTGTQVIGTLNNCAAGKTPWGTVLSAEENFQQYFANLSLMDNEDERKVMHARYGVPEEASDRRWENFYDRFDVTKEPNELFRFGWVVEIDPYNPDFIPVKRTALGRFKHEAATTTVAPNGQVVLYSGDDERFEYIYKFVTQGSYDENNREANFKLLDEGTLYIAKFNDDGSGEWLPMVYGQGKLTAANGFSSQGDVLIRTREAADLMGATKMDRPEDIETNPVNKKVYMVMTKNDRRGAGTAESPQPDVDAANPRQANKDGHIIEVTEANNDPVATSFSWEIFMLCGHPSDETTYFGGYDKNQVSAISSPDNITFDLAGNMWISTDGQPSTLFVNDGVFVVPVEGPERGHLKQFFSSVPGSEVCGPEFTPDNSSLFLAIQHPGEGGDFEHPASYWPDYKAPTRPSVVVVQAGSGDIIKA